MGRPPGTKDRLLQAAIDLLWDESLADASVDAICVRAGVRRGSFYHFFRSKEDLVAAALDAKFEAIRPELDRIFSPSVRPLDRLRGCLDLLLEDQRRKLQQVGRVVGCCYASVGASCGTGAQAIQRKAQQLLEIQMRYLETAIRDGQAEGSIPAGKPRALAQAVHDYLEGALTAARIQNDLKPIRNLERGVFALLGLGRPVRPATSRRGS